MEGSLMLSSDGLYWTRSKLPTGTVRISWTGSEYAIAGDVLFTGRDTVNWKRHVLGTTQSLWDVCWDGKKLLVIGGDSVFASADQNHADCVENGIANRLAAVWDYGSGGAGCIRGERNSDR